MILQGEFALYSRDAKLKLSSSLVHGSVPAHPTSAPRISVNRLANSMVREFPPPLLGQKRGHVASRSPPQAHI
jgi:hypothetical protein